MRLLHNVFIYMGDLHLVLPAMIGLPHVFPLAVHLEWLGTPSWHSRGTKGIYLDFVGPFRPSKRYRVGWVVDGGAHKILVTSPEAKFLFPFLVGDLDFGLGLGLRLVNSMSVLPTRATLKEQKEVCPCLHKVYTQIAQSLQFTNSLSASKSKLIWAAHKNL